MSDPAQILKDFKPTKSFFVGIDSDGCIFDSMEIKHKECFTPMFNQTFPPPGGQQIRPRVWEFVNLLFENPGANRFPALVRSLNLLRERPQILAAKSRLRNGCPRRVDRKRNQARQRHACCRGQKRKPGLAQVKAWSDAVNAAIEDIVHGVPPFPSCASASPKSIRRPTRCASHKPRPTLSSGKWAEHGIDKFVK